MQSKTIIATIVIPSHNRQEKTERAIASVLRQPGAARTKIVVVDDASTVPFTSQLLRLQDVCLRNTTNAGAAASRNQGIALAEGKLIFLLDSDDYFVERDFEALYKEIDDGAEHGIWYCDISSQDGTRHFPDKVTKDDFLDAVFWKHPRICQTSSLCFPASLKLLFDESLPKHQDWDFVYAALASGMPLRRKRGLVFFDRSDSSSLSKSYSPLKSFPWYNKLQALSGALRPDPCFVRFHLFAFYPDLLHLKEFLGVALRLLKSKHTNAKFILKAIYFRLNYRLDSLRKVGSQ
ncbi:MAG: glycosyltransferase [Microlunatus sp.]